MQHCWVQAQGRHACRTERHWWHRLSRKASEPEGGLGVVVFLSSSLAFSQPLTAQEQQASLAQPLQVAQPLAASTLALAACRKGFQRHKERRLACARCFCCCWWSWSSCRSKEPIRGRRRRQIQMREEELIARITIFFSKKKLFKNIFGRSLLLRRRRILIIINRCRNHTASVYYQKRIEWRRGTHEENKFARIVFESRSDSSVESSFSSGQT